MDKIQQYLYTENYEETDESLSILRGSEDPSLLVSFKTHIAEAIWNQQVLHIGCFYLLLLIPYR